MFSGWMRRVLPKKKSKMNFKILHLIHEASLQCKCGLLLLKTDIDRPLGTCIIMPKLREETERSCFMDQTTC